MSSQSAIWLGLIAVFVSVGLLLIGRGLALHPGTRGRWWKMLAFVVAIGLSVLACARYYRLITSFWQGALFGVGATVLSEMVRRLIWSYYGRRRRARESSKLPAISVALEQAAIGGVFYLNVTNNGPEASFQAKLDIGEHSTAARWEHVESAISAIAQGQTRKLRLARFSSTALSPFEFTSLRSGVWTVFSVSDNKMMEMRLPVQTDLMGIFGNPTSAIVTIYADPPLGAEPFTYGIDLRTSKATAHRITKRLQRL